LGWRNDGLVLLFLFLCVGCASGGELRRLPGRNRGLLELAPDVKDYVLIVYEKERELP